MEKSEIKKFAEKSNAWPFVEARNLRDRLDKIENYAPKDNNTPVLFETCLLYTSPSPRDLSTSRMPSSA